MTHVWEAAKFDDACTVPTPCLLLSGIMYSCDVESPDLHGFCLLSYLLRVIPNRNIHRTIDVHPFFLQ